MNRQKIIAKEILKYSIYIFVVYVLYILQSTPGFLSFFGIKPTFLIPFCLTLCILDEQWHTWIVYIIAGLLNEISSSRVSGFHCIMILLVAIAGSIGTRFFFAPTRRNTIMFVLVSMLIIFSIDFSLSYTLRGYSNYYTIYIDKVVSVSIYSSVFSLIFYPFIEFMNFKFVKFDAR